MMAVAQPSVEGLERFEATEGPVIFAANHSSHLDTPLVLTVLPEPWRHKTVTLAAADYFFDSRVEGGILCLLSQRGAHRAGKGEPRFSDAGRTSHRRRLEPFDLPRRRAQPRRVGATPYRRRGVVGRPQRAPPRACPHNGHGSPAPPWRQAPVHRADHRNFWAADNARSPGSPARRPPRRRHRGAGRRSDYRLVVSAPQSGQRSHPRFDRARRGPLAPGLGAWAFTQRRRPPALFRRRKTVAPQTLRTAGVGRQLGRTGLLWRGRGWRRPRLSRPFHVTVG